MSGLLEVEGLCVDVTTEHDQVRVVDAATFSVDVGECVALVGESGAGKTLTARAVLGLLPRGAHRSGGEVRWRGRNVDDLTAHERRALLGFELAYVPQEPALDPVMRVGRQLVEAMRVHGLSRRAARRRAEELLATVGIADPRRQMRSHAHQLSGGMQQRVMLALALANDPALVVADEPTTALDVVTQAQILGELDAVRRRTGQSVLLVSHDLGVVAGVADRVLVMYAGRIVESRPVEGLFARPHHPYTTALLDALPRIGDDRGALPAVPGAPPDPARRPSGCAFHPRCAYAVERCVVERPSAVGVADGGTAACIRIDAIAASILPRSS